MDAFVPISSRRYECDGEQMVDYCCRRHYEEDRRRRREDRRNRMACCNRFVELTPPEDWDSDDTDIECPRQQLDVPTKSASHLCSLDRMELWTKLRRQYLRRNGRPEPKYIEFRPCDQLSPGCWPSGHPDGSIRNPRFRYRGRRSM